MASSDTTIIPRIDPTHYTWSPHPSVPFLYVRRALGAETKWAHIPTANRQLFVTGKITKLTESTSQAALFFAARKAWMRMRFEYPEVVQKHSGDFNSDGSAIMQCEVPKDDADAEAWVQRTLHTCTDPVDETAAMTAAEEELRKQETTDPVSVRLHSINSPPERGTSRATRSAFSMRVDHGLADGMGVYLLIGKYFQLLGEELGGREWGPLDWTKASDRIPKAWMELLDDEQKTKGQDFEESVRRNMDLIMDSVNNQWSLKFQPSNEYKPRSMQHTFSPSQTKAVLRSIKTDLGLTYSITHLGHAAVTMTLLKLKPPLDRPLDQKDIILPLFMNGRRYLDAKQPKSTDHIPLCRAISAVEFRDVERYICVDEDSKQEVREKLKIACEEARRSYQRIREQKSLLTESFFVLEALAKANNDAKDKTTADPIFLPDGIIEQYTPRIYTNAAGTQELFSLNDIRFTANPAGPSVLIRMSTFRDSIRVSAEWNAPFYAEDDVRRFLDSVVDLITSFTDDDEGDP